MKKENHPSRKPRPSLSRNRVRSNVSPLEIELRKYISQDDIDAHRDVLEDIERNGPRLP
jgi:hypothetical protein